MFLPYSILDGSYKHDISAQKKLWYIFPYDIFISSTWVEVDLVCYANAIGQYYTVRNI